MNMNEYDWFIITMAGLWEVYVGLQTLCRNDNEVFCCPRQFLFLCMVRLRQNSVFIGEYGKEDDRAELDCRMIAKLEVAQCPTASDPQGDMLSCFFNNASQNNQAEEGDESLVLLWQEQGISGKGCRQHRDLRILLLDSFSGQRQV